MLGQLQVSGLGRKEGPYYSWLLHAKTKVCIRVWLPWLSENLSQAFSKEKVPTGAADLQNSDNSFLMPQKTIFS